MSGASNNIFDELMILSECQYLSDLPHPHSRDVVRVAVEKLSEDAYSVEEWNELVSYISGGSCDYASPNEAKSALVEFLNTPSE